MDIWEDRFTEVCRRHHDLVAVYESPRGRLALLLRQTLVPLGPEHFEWLAETRATARAVIADLRVAGFDGATVVLQWLPFGDVASIVSRWVRRWDGDQVRRTQLLAVVDSHLSRPAIPRRAGLPGPARRGVGSPPTGRVRRSGRPGRTGRRRGRLAVGSRRRPTDRSARLVRADGAVLACDRATAASTTRAADSRVDRRARALPIPTRSRRRRLPASSTTASSPVCSSTSSPGKIGRRGGRGSSWSASTCSGPWRGLPPGGRRPGPAGCSSFPTACRRRVGSACARGRATVTSSA